MRGVEPLPPRPLVSARSPLRVAPSGRHLEQDGRPVFLLADTLWAAFSRMTEDEWVDVLRLRRRQGFNAVQVSVLPIAHDRSLGGRSRAPFLEVDGRWDLDAPDPAYFDRARSMVATAADLGLTVVLVVLWCTYVPDTWGSARTPELALDEARTERYLDLVLDFFADLGPVLCVSGDDSLDSPVALARYRSALHRLKAGAPECLTTLHSTPSAVLPPDLAADPALDLYAYQAGHDDSWAERSAALAERHAGLVPVRPVHSMEPCYEGHGFGGGRERHDARDVRRASWTGLLAGAGGGLGYAVHGAWSWHRAGEEFIGEHFSGLPLPAARAVELPGAWDVGLLRRLVEQHGLQDLRSRQDLVLDDRSGARLGVSPDGRRAAAYLPHAFRLRLGLDLDGWSVETWDLGHGRRDHVAWSTDRDGTTTFEQPETTADLVHVLRR